MGKFEVVTCDDTEEEIKFYKRVRNMAMWCNQHRSVVEKAFKNYKTLAEMPQDILSRLVFCGIRYALSVEDYIKIAKDMDGVADARVWFEYLNVIFETMGYMTIKNFVTTFPITKDYDGEKYGCKDYFFTVDMLKQYDPEERIGQERVKDFLFDYQNMDIHRAVIMQMCYTSKLYQQETGRNMAEEFLNDILSGPEDEENGFKIDSETGEISKVPKKYQFEPVE
ncbi:hypothetical protein ACTNEY_05100 [Fusicatenibacter saccharivorans]|uniref:hypothetical protein n=1 Tax=Fusicatenibacter saccharivorans TaxID=1150298 RepID=UPI003F8C68CA